MRNIRWFEEIFVIAAAGDVDVDATAAGTVATDTVGVEVPFDFCICKRIEQIVFQYLPKAGTLISFATGNVDTHII